MNERDFLKRFASRTPLPAAPALDRDDLARWAEQFRAGLPARREALAEEFKSALQSAGGVFHPARDAEDAAGVALEIARAQGAQRAIAWDDPALAAARAALEGTGIAVALSALAPGIERAQVRAATVAADVGLTTAAYAVAQTGTLVLVHGAHRGRLTSLAPGTHIALIHAGDLVPTFADVVKLLRLARLSSDGRLPSNISLHTGPSKTADIEQTLTKGVHGPKAVHVICMAD